MPRVIFQVSDAEKALMVEAAHRELVTLSEWLRRAADVRLGGLAAGDTPGAVTGPSAGSVPATARAGDAASTGSDDAKASTAPAPAARPLSGFQPDFKKGK